MHCIAYETDNPEKPVGYITQDERDGKWNKKIMYYDIVGECRTMSNKDIKRAFNIAMTTWDIEIDIVFKPSWVDQVTPDITLDFKSSDLDKLFKDSSGVLAYAYYPAQGTVSGKIVFNDDYIWDFSGKGIKAGDALAKGWINGTSNPDNVIKTYSIIAVLIHELGHSLGLTHDVSGNKEGTDVMDAYYSGADRFELSERDLFRILLKYPARKYSSWNAYGRLKNAIKRSKLRL